MLIVKPQIPLDRLQSVAEAWHALAGDPDPRAQETARCLRLTLRDLGLRIVQAGQGVALEPEYLLPWADLLRPLDRAWLLDCGVAPELADLLVTLPGRG